MNDFSKIVCLVGFSLFAMTACSSDKGTAHEGSQTAISSVVVDPKKDLEEGEQIGRSSTTKISRYIDCEAHITIYTSFEGIAIIKNSDVNHELIKEKCG